MKPLCLGNLFSILLKKKGHANVINIVMQRIIGILEGNMKTHNLHQMNKKDTWCVTNKSLLIVLSQDTQPSKG
jgi:hypothetical protein